MGTLCAFLLIACYFDYRYRRIPNLLSGTMLAAGLVRSYLLHGRSGILIFVFAGLVLLLILYPFFKLGALGAGDVKLFGICSGYLAYDKILYFLFFSLLIAAIISLIKIITEHNAKERFRYLGDYFLEVVRSGQWHLYIKNKQEGYKSGIPLAGPILCSVLMSIGGVY